MLFQPTNIYPSKFGGLGNGVVDVNEDLTVSWQVNGNSAMTKFKIDILQNNAASTSVYSTGVLTDGCPFYGTTYDGSVQFFTYTITSATLITAGMANGNEYKMVITQYWGATTDANYVVQSSASAFTTQATPTVTLTNPTAGATITANSITATATYTPSTSDLNWQRWQIAAYSNGNYIELDDTGNIFGTNQLKYVYNGLFTGNSYAIKCDIELSNGVQATTGWVVFSVSYSTSEIEGQVGVECANEIGGIKVTLPTIRNIPATITGSYTLSNSYLNLASGATAVWNTVDSAAMNFTSPMNVIWRGKGDADGTLVKLKTGATSNITASIASSGLGATFVTQTGYKMAYGNGVWIMFPLNPDMALNSQICRSINNGNTWSYPFNIAEGQYIYDFCYGEAGFVAVLRATAFPYKGSLWQSDDGLTWTQVKVLNDAVNKANITCVNGRYMGTATYSSSVYSFSSADAETWVVTRVKQESLYLMPGRIGNTWVLIPNGNSSLTGAYYSTDNGANWTAITLPVSGKWGFCKVCNNRLFLVHRISSGSHVLYTENGITWTDTGLIDISDIDYHNGTYVAMYGNTNTNITTVKTSTDLSTWANSASITIFAPRLIWNGSMFVAYPNVSSAQYSTDRIYYSYNGTTWVWRTGPVQYLDSTVYEMPSPVYNADEDYWLYPTGKQIVRAIPSKQLQITDGTNTIHFDYLSISEITFILGGLSGLPYVYFSSINGVEGAVVSNEPNLFTMNTISQIEMVGKVSCDYLIVSQGLIDNATQQSLLNDVYFHPSNIQSYFYADFAYSANGGSVGGTPLEGWSVYRDVGDPVLRHIGDVLIDEGNVIYDCGVVNGQTAKYWAFGLAATTFASEAIISDEISPVDWSWVLLSCVVGSDGYYHPVDVFRFRNNTSISTITNNNAPNVLPNFTRYPTVQLSNLNYQSGTLTGLIGTVANGRYSDSVEERNAIYELSTTTNTLFLKSRKGDLIKIRLSGAISMDTINESEGQFQMMSLPWVEVGDAKDEAIVLTSVDALWGM